MGCEPDRASYNIMVDAYGRAGLRSGKTHKKLLVAKVNSRICSKKILTVKFNNVMK